MLVITLSQAMIEDMLVGFAIATGIVGVVVGLYCELLTKIFPEEGEKEEEL